MGITRTKRWEVAGGYHLWLWHTIASPDAITFFDLEVSLSEVFSFSAGFPGRCIASYRQHFTSWQISLFQAVFRQVQRLTGRAVIAPGGTFWSLRRARRCRGFSFGRWLTYILRWFMPDDFRAPLADGWYRAEIPTAWLSSTYGFATRQRVSFDRYKSDTACIP